MTQLPTSRRGFRAFLHRHAAATIVVLIAIYVLVGIGFDLSRREWLEFGRWFIVGIGVVVTIALTVWGVRRWINSRALARMRARRNAPDAPPTCPNCGYPLTDIAPVKNRVLGFWAERVVCPECGWAPP